MLPNMAKANVNTYYRPMMAGLGVNTNGFTVGRTAKSAPPTIFQTTSEYGVETPVTSEFTDVADDYKLAEIDDYGKYRFINACVIDSPFELVDCPNDTNTIKNGAIGSDTTEAAALGADDIQADNQASRNEIFNSFNVAFARPNSARPKENVQNAGFEEVLTKNISETVRIRSVRECKLPATPKTPSKKAKTFVLDVTPGEKAYISGSSPFNLAYLRATNDLGITKHWNKDTDSIEPVTETDAFFNDMKAKGEELPRPNSVSPELLRTSAGFRAAECQRLAETTRLITTDPAIASIGRKVNSPYRGQRMTTDRFTALLDRLRIHRDETETEVVVNTYSTAMTASEATDQLLSAQEQCTEKLKRSDSGYISPARSAESREAGVQHGRTKSTDSGVGNSPQSKLNPDAAEFHSVGGTTSIGDGSPVRRSAKFTRPPVAGLFQGQGQTTFVRPPPGIHVMPSNPINPTNAARLLLQPDVSYMPQVNPIASDLLSVSSVPSTACVAPPPGFHEVPVNTINPWNAHELVFDNTPLVALGAPAGPALLPLPPSGYAVRQPVQQMPPPGLFGPVPSVRSAGPGPAPRKPRAPDTCDQLAYEEYIEWRKAHEPGYAQKCRSRQQKRAAKRQQQERA